MTAELEEVNWAAAVLVCNLTRVWRRHCSEREVRLTHTREQTLINTQSGHDPLNVSIQTNLAPEACANAKANAN